MVVFDMYMCVSVRGVYVVCVWHYMCVLYVVCVYSVWYVLACMSVCVVCNVVCV